MISTGCPSGIGPEVAVGAAYRLREIPCILVGDGSTLERAREIVAERLGARARKPLVPFLEGGPVPQLSFLQAGPPLGARDRRPGKPTQRSGAAQLAYLQEAFRLARTHGWPLATGPVSKEVIAGSEEAACPDFRGHTEWLEAQDGADHSVMCFASPRLVTSLVTTHIPLSWVPGALTVEGVSHAILELVALLHRIGKSKPRVTVCSLNPHAGEGELLGSEERLVIAPALAACRARLGRKAVLTGPIGAETAYRKAYAGAFDGVVAMYHDQATIPMKLVAFGDAVNVTLGLSIVRTSVDHGTGYDIAGRGTANDDGMVAAIRLAAQLATPPGSPRGAGSS